MVSHGSHATITARREFILSLLHHGPTFSNRVDKTTGAISDTINCGSSHSSRSELGGSALNTPFGNAHTGGASRYSPDEPGQSLHRLLLIYSVCFLS